MADITLLTREEYVEQMAQGLMKQEGRAMDEFNAAVNAYTNEYKGASEALAQGLAADFQGSESLRRSAINDFVRAARSIENGYDMLIEIANRAAEIAPGSNHRLATVARCGRFERRAQTARLAMLDDKRVLFKEVERQNTARLI